MWKTQPNPKSTCRSPSRDAGIPDAAEEIHCNMVAASWPNDEPAGKVQNAKNIGNLLILERFSIDLKIFHDIQLVNG